MSKEIILTDSNFEEEVMKSDIPVLVDFWAGWCTPCKMLAPTIEELADEYEGKLKVAKCEVDANKELSDRFSIMSIPSILLFKNGEVIEQVVGVQPKENLIHLFEQHL